MLKVLVVEDDINVSRLHTKFTEKIDGFEVIGVANDLDDAYEMIDLFNPDLILLDIFFPMGSGIEFLKKIREKESSADVIMITAAREAQTVRQAFHGGAYDYIVKPVIFDRFKNSMIKFREYRKGLSTDTSFDQEDIDQLLIRNQNQPTATPSQLPKGIDPITLEKVKLELAKTSTSITAESMGQSIGASRNTARRYLDYLLSIGAIEVDMDYGTIGRPIKKFKPRQNL